MLPLTRSVIRLTALAGLLTGLLVSGSVYAGIRLNRTGDSLILYWAGEPIQGGTTTINPDGLVLWDWRRDLRHPYFTGCRFRGFAVSPDSHQIALDAQCREPSNSIYVMDTSGRNFRRLSEGGTLFGILYWSPDSTHLAYTLNRTQTLTITTLDLQTSQAQQHLSVSIDKDSLEMLLGYTPDGQQLVINRLPNGRLVGNSETDSQIYLLDSSTQTKTLLPVTVTVPRWSPDGSRLLYTLNDSTRNQNVYRVVDEQGSTLQEIALPVGAYDIAWSPDSRRIAFLSHETNIAKNQSDAVLLLDISTGKLDRIAPAGYYIFQPVWQADNHHLSFLGGFPQLYIYTLDLETR
ncbi:MAG TPA: hypothetical protein VHL11_14430, partial [Phototrophicaceae bacterium]|nr:hypothetical protein [Phototrophicaceae bacterium]